MRRSKATVQQALEQRGMTVSQAFVEAADAMLAADPQSSQRYDP